MEQLIDVTRTTHPVKTKHIPDIFQHTKDISMIEDILMINACVFTVTTIPVLSSQVHGN